MASELPVDLLEEIFLHLDEAADLARASAACTSFRRIVSDHRFLRRFIRSPSLHRRRPVLGLLENRGGGENREIVFYPAQSPRLAALAAGACAEAADFTFSFVPHPKCWRVRDARDGRVLLSRSRFQSVSYALQDLVVCDPLHRRHVLIPPIPDDLLDAAASTEHGGDQQELEFEPFLAPAPEANDKEDDRDGHELSFRVMCNALSKTKVVAFAFSSAGRQWRAVTSFTNPIYVWTKLSSVWFRQSVRSCFYWTNSYENFVLVLDTCGTMRFSIIIITDIPQTSYYGRSKIAVEAGVGRLGLLLVDDNKLELYSKAWQGNNGGVFVPEPAEEWRHDNTIPLPIAGLWILSVAADGYAVLRGHPMDQVDLSVLDPMNHPSEAHYFTVDLKTLLLENLGVLKYGSVPEFLYASFPPPFSPPTI